MNPSQGSQLTLFTEDSLDHANPSPWLVTRKDGTTLGSCGLSFRGWSERLARVGSWLRTYLASFPLPPMTSARIWSVSATASGFGILKLWLSGHPTEGRGCSLLPTPTVNGNYNRKGLSKTSGDGLATFVRKLLPTPTANDAKCNGTASPQNRNSDALNVVAGGALNPEWVEWLMGFPRGWTEVSGLESQRVSREQPEAFQTGWRG